MYGAVEAGGTKFVCAVGTGPDNLLERVQFPTRTPEETMARVIAFFKPHLSRLEAIGVGTFGPVDVHPTSPTYGTITSTPKPGWQYFNIREALERALHVPVYVETDVNAAALGEHQWGAGQGLHTFVYITVGTGIGGGALVEGHLLHGLMHPEMGHMRVPHYQDQDPFPGICPFHGDCLEGLASGPAMAERWHADPATLPPEHPAWDLEAHYLAWAVVNLVTILAPQRVILGGGVMHQEHLFPRIRDKASRILADYVAPLASEDAWETYIVPPALGDNAGILGALALALRENAG